MDVHARSSVDYMLRSAQQNQMALTALADQKANIVLGLAFLTISLSATHLAQNDIPPALLVLLISAIIAGLFALAALLPRSSVAGRHARGTGDEPTYNPLFLRGYRIRRLPRISRANGRTHAH